MVCLLDGVWDDNELCLQESSVVSCGHACARMFRKNSESCNALMFSSASKECHLGTALLAGEGDQGGKELVYVIQGTGGRSSTLTPKGVHRTWVHASNLNFQNGPVTDQTD